MSDESTLPTKDGWWLCSQGPPTGPHSPAYILAGLKTGVISPQTNACPVGGEEWKRLCYWSAFAATCAVMPHPQATNVAASPPPSSTLQVPHACLLCGKEKEMGERAKVLYGHVVCQKCYDSFANRRLFAFAMDSIGWYFVLFLIAAFLGITMAAAGSSQSDIEGAGNALWLLLLPVFLCKDCFSGQSLGKAICGVRVINQATGEPGGIGASFKRNLPLLIPYMPFVVGYQLGKGHRIGDGWSHTKVIWKRYARHPIFAATAGSANSPST